MRKFVEGPEVWRESLDRCANNEQVPYLGNPQVIADLLRLACNEVLTEGNQDTLRKASSHVADILLGKDAGYSTICSNRPGGIDVFAANELGLGGDTPEDRMQNCVLACIREMFELRDYASQPGVTSDLWKPQVDAIINKYALLFVGLPLSTQMLMR